MSVHATRVSGRARESKESNPIQNQLFGAARDLLLVSDEQSGKGRTRDCSIRQCRLERVARYLTNYSENISFHQWISCGIHIWVHASCFYSAIMFVHVSELMKTDCCQNGSGSRKAQCRVLVVVWEGILISLLCRNNYIGLFMGVPISQLNMHFPISCVDFLCTLLHVFCQCIFSTMRLCWNYYSQHQKENSSCPENQGKKRVEHHKERNKKHYGRWKRRRERGGEGEGGGDEGARVGQACRHAQLTPFEWPPSTCECRRIIPLSRCKWRLSTPLIVPYATGCWRKLQLIAPLRQTLPRIAWALSVILGSTVGPIAMAWGGTVSSRRAKLVYCFLCDRVSWIAIGDAITYRPIKGEAGSCRWGHGMDNNRVLRYSFHPDGRGLVHE